MQFRFSAQFISRSAVAILAIAALQLTACAPAPSATPHEKPAIVDKEKKSVTLTDKAAERLGVETIKVTEEQAARTRKVGADVVDASKVASATKSSASTGEVWVRVSMNASDLSAMDAKQPARVLGIDDGGDDDKDEAGTEVEMDEAEGAESNTDAGDDEDKPVYFKIKGTGHSLKVGQRARVEFTLQGNGASHKLVPYSAVIYDVKGATWVYTNPEGKVYLRQPVKVDYIKGQLAYLSEGPAAGTSVVTRGVAELYGAETGVGK